MVATVQACPFQRIASVRPNDTESLPTAHTGPPAAAAAPNRKLSPDPTLGLGTMLHLEPFQCSVSVRR